MKKLKFDILTKFGAQSPFRPWKLLFEPLFMYLYDLMKNMKKLKFDILTKCGGPVPLQTQKLLSLPIFGFL
jgi:hypothetical protein